MEQTTRDEQVAAQVQAMVASFGDDWPRLRGVAARVVWAVDPAAGAFFAPTIASFQAAFTDPDERRMREALYLLATACGVEEGVIIPRSLRAAILAGLGLAEPALPPWVQPGAYAFSEWHGARGLNKRIVAIDTRGVLLAGRTEPLESGLFLAAWTPPREDRPEGLPCALCGIERDMGGLCNGCVAPLQARCAVALARGDGYSRRVDPAGAVVYQTVIVSASWERRLTAPKIVVEGMGGTGTSRMLCDTVEEAAELFAAVVIFAATGKPMPDVVAERAGRALLAGQFGLCALGSSLEKYRPLRPLPGEDLPHRKPTPPLAIVNGHATRDITAGKLVTMDMVSFDRATFTVSGPGAHGNEVTETLVLPQERVPLRWETPAPPPRTSALGTDWATYDTVEAAVEAVSRRGEST